MKFLGILVLFTGVLLGCSNLKKEGNRDVASYSQVLTDAGASIHELIIKDTNYQAGRDEGLRVRRTLGIGQSYYGRKVLAVIIQTKLRRNARSSALRMELRTQGNTLGQITHRFRESLNGEKYHVIPIHLNLGEELRSFRLHSMEGSGVVSKIGVVLAKEEFDGDWNGPTNPDRNYINLTRPHLERVYPSRSRGGSEHIINFEGRSRAKYLSVRVLRNRVQFHEAYIINGNGRRIDLDKFDGRLVNSNERIIHYFNRNGRSPIMSQLVIRAEGYDGNDVSYQLTIEPADSTGGIDPVPPRPTRPVIDNSMECVAVNSYGAYAQGGGCNSYGCYYKGGGCNSYGCYSEGGRCSSYGCIRGVTRTSKACKDWIQTDDSIRYRQCINVNSYGKYARNGGCNSYGCYYPGGGCNSYGCYYKGGGCNSYGCTRKAPNTREACVE